MFKFIHASDIHLDSPLRGLSRYESAPVDSIRNACRNAFINLVDLAIEEKVSFVLLAGDLYDGHWKDYNTGIFLGQQMGRLHRCDIKVFAVAGNHDAANKMTRSLNHPASMTVLSSRKPETITMDEWGAAIHGQSFKTSRVDENLAAGFPAAKKGLFNIGLLHTSLDGREGHAAYAPCSADDLRSKGYQYWALGHIHKQEFVSKDPWIVFPGCIQGRHIRETGAKGCLIVTVEEGAVISVKKRALDVLRWVECVVDLTDADERGDVIERAQKSIQSAVSSADGRPVAMRIRFQGATSLSNELSALPEQFERQIKALGAEISNDDLWMERIVNATTGKLDLESTLSEDSAFGKLIKEILATPNHPDKINGLKEAMAVLRRKIPPDAFGPDSILNLDDHHTIKRLIKEAKDMLVGRLLTEGDTK